MEKLGYETNPIGKNLIVRGAGVWSGRAKRTAYGVYVSSKSFSSGSDSFRPVMKASK